MKNDEQIQKQQWKMMKHRETTMKNDEKERKKQWKTMKNEVKKTRKHDEK